jgi:hypothetical protein
MESIKKRGVCWFTRLVPMQARLHHRRDHLEDLHGRTHELVAQLNCEGMHGCFGRGINWRSSKLHIAL